MATGTLTQSLRETLALFEATGTPKTTTEVAAELDLGRRSTYDRLERLVEHGKLETKKVGANARVWWQPSTTVDDSGSYWPGGLESLTDEVLDKVDAGLFVLDDNFDVVWVNETTERYFGLDRDEVLGADKRTLIEEQVTVVMDDPEEFAETVLATYDENTYTEQFECQVTSGAGREQRWLEHRSKPIESGTYAGGRIELYYDITHQKQTEQALREFESLVDAVEEYAIFTLDTDGYVRTWNSGAEQIKGYEPDEILGEHLSTFYTQEDREDGIPEENLAKVKKHGFVEDEGWRVRADGSTFWANVTITAIHDDDGDLQGYAKVTRDMTERHETEQELRDTNALLDSVLDTKLDVIYATDRRGHLIHWNDQLCVVTGYTDDDLAGMPATELVPEEVIDDAVEATNRVLEDGESVTVELPLETADGETVPYEFSGSPITDENGTITGLTGIGRDIRDRKARERQLRRQREDIASELDDVFARIDDGFYAVDDEYRFTYVNDQAETLLQHSEEELLGRRVWDVFPDVTETPAYDAFKTAMETQEPTEFDIYFEPLDFWVEASVYPSESGLSVYFRDITERKERERELEQYETVTQTAPDTIVTIDTDSTIRNINPASADVFGYEPEELVGESLTTLMPDRLVDGHEAAVDAYLQTGERTLDWDFVEFPGVRADGTEIPLAVSFSEYEYDDQRYFTGILRDITERKEHQRTLEKQIRQQEVVANLGEQALKDASLDTLFAEASRLVAETLDNEYCKVLDLQERDSELLLRQGVGWKEGLVGEATVSSVEDDSQAAYTLSHDEPIVVENLGTESRFSGPELLTSHDVKSGISVIIGSQNNPWGILGTHDTEQKEFTEQDANFVQSVANILASAIDRHRNERQLLRQREELEALNSINEVVREVTSAVIEQSTRAEIEETVCQHLADSESYRFAWVGEPDLATQTVDVRTEAQTEGYTDEITISLDSADDRSRGPTARALKTRETKVTRDIRADPDYEPWREVARQYDFRSSAAIPIIFGNTLYGVLNLYSRRPYAFDTREQQVISQLGEVIGHAIAATERKRALMSDELVELEFHISDFFEVFDAQICPQGTVTLDTVVPIGDGEFLIYGTATHDAVEGFSALIDSIPYEAQIRFRDGDGTRQFELRLSDPPTLSEIAALGGSVEEAVIEDGDYHLTIHLSPSTDVGHVIEIVQETYPGAEMVARRQIERAEDTSEHVYDELSEELTERQRASLRAAYHAGFFEWPRDVNAETVAESLGIAPATFSQHLRKGEKKVFDALLSDADEVLDYGD